MTNITSLKESKVEKDSISLAPIHRKEAPTLAQLANNKKIWDNMRDYMPYPYALNDAYTFLEQIAENPSLTVLGIKLNGKLCGVIGLNRQTDIYRHSAEVGYWIGEEYWGKGIATVALGLISYYAFNELRLERIYSSVFEYNPASMRVLEKNGFLKEGTGIRSALKNGKLWNEHRYALLKEISLKTPA